MIHTYDKTAATLAGLRHITWAKRVLIYTVTLGLLIQNIAVATASVLTARDVQRYVNAQPLFERAVQYADYQHTTGDYLEQSATSAMTIDSFHQRLKEDFPQILPPKYVTITSGGVPIVAPTYDKPRPIGSPMLQGRYARDQVHALLGINLINGTPDSGYDSDRNQLNTLYSNMLAMLNSGEIQQPYCAPLNRDQENSGLSNNIVWPECHIIHGERVVVPVVYLTGATVSEYRVDDHRAVLAGTSSFRELTIDNVTVTTGRNSFLQVAGNLLNNQGTIQGEGDLSIVAGGALVNLSGRITSQDNLSIEAALIQSNTLVHRYDFDGRQGGSFGQIATFQSNGNLLLTSHSDILINGGIANGGGNLVFNAGGSIYVGPVQYTDNFSSDSRQTTRSHILQSFLTAEQSIALIAQDEIKIDASEIVAGEYVELLAGLGITVEDELSSNYVARNYYDHGYDVHTETFQTVAIRSLIDAGKKVRLHTTLGDVTLRASDVRSTQGAEITAAGGKLRLLTTTETDHYSYSAVKESLFTISTINRGHTAETLAYPTIVGGLEVNALYGLEVEYEGDSTLANDLDAQIASLSQVEGMEWMQELRNDASLNIDWQTASTFYNEWDKDSTSLSPAAIAFITIVVAVFTAGAASGIVTALQTAGANSAVAAGVGAAFTAAVTTASIATGNAIVNGGDPAEVFEAAFESIHNEEGIKSTITAALTAGVLNGINGEFFNAENLSFGEQIQQAVVDATVRSGVSTAINGGSFSDALKYSLLQNAANLTGDAISGEISELASNGDINTALQRVAYVGVGCLVGSAQNSSDGCESGALGSTIGQIVAELQSESDFFEGLVNATNEFGERLYSDAQIKQLLANTRDFSRGRLNSISPLINHAGLYGALSAMFVGLDANIASGAANTARNTALEYTALSFMNALDKERELNSRLGFLSDISALEAANANEITETIDAALLEEAELLGLRVKENVNGVHYVEEPGGVGRRIANNNLFRELNQAQEENLKRSAALSDNLKRAEAELVAFNERIQELKREGLQAHFETIEFMRNQLGPASGTTAQEIADAVGYQGYDEFSSVITEGVFLATDSLLFGAPGLVLAFADIDSPIPLTDAKLAVATSFLFEELEKEGVPRHVAEGILLAAGIAASAKDIKELVLLGGRGAKRALDRLTNRRNGITLDDLNLDDFEISGAPLHDVEVNDFSNHNVMPNGTRFDIELAGTPTSVNNFDDRDYFSFFDDTTGAPIYDGSATPAGYLSRTPCAINCILTASRYLDSQNAMKVEDAIRVGLRENLFGHGAGGGLRRGKYHELVNQPDFANFGFTASSHEILDPYVSGGIIENSLSQGLPVIVDVKVPKNKSIQQYFYDLASNPNDPSLKMQSLINNKNAGGHAVIIRSKTILPNGSTRWEIIDPTQASGKVIAVNNNLFDEVIGKFVTVFTPKNPTP